MSLPLSRRIVQAAFVVAAGAVPAVLTGVAHAAPALPGVPDLGGLSRLDSGALGDDVQSAAHQTGDLTGNGAGDAVASTVPSVTDAAGGATAKALPQADSMLGSTTGELAQVAGSTTAASSGLAGSASGATRAIPVGTGNTGLPATDSATGALSSLPLGSLPVDQLPLGQATSALSGATDPAAAPAQRLGGLPALGDTSSLGAVTQALPLAGGGLPV
ncbi:ATP-binding protein [Streptacidiphilus cavernicola]|uniref:ATP-binding protein n=1 Tax=Streptacidiphilus cavernicola TaxID=3342716 RepID=A0ABV6VUP6_9ACTN